VTRVRLTALVVLVAVAAPVAGCGKSGPKIPQRKADDIVAKLQEAQRRNSPLRCDDLKRDTIPVLQQQVRSLPSKTDKDIRDTLSEGIDNLRNLVAAECLAKAPKVKKPTTTESTQTQPTTSPTTSPTTTDTTPTTDTTTNTTPTTTTNTTPTGPSGGTPPGQQKKAGKGKGK
jgi:predicted small lipoprotein YifL